MIVGKHFLLNFHFSKVYLFLNHVRKKILNFKIWSFFHWSINQIINNLRINDLTNQFNMQGIVMNNANWPFAINIQLYFSTMKASSILSKEKYIKPHYSIISLTKPSKKETDTLIGITSSIVFISPLFHQAPFTATKLSANFSASPKHSNHFRHQTRSSLS